MSDSHPHEVRAALYLATRVRVMPGGAWISAREAVASLGAFHVITAWNPGDERPGRAANDAANEALRAELVAAGCTPHPAIGCDPASDHAEEGFAFVGLSDEAACAIGRRFGQWAVFRIESATQTVVGCFGAWSVARRLEEA